MPATRSSRGPTLTPAALVGALLVLAGCGGTSPTASDAGPGDGIALEVSVGGDAAADAGGDATGDTAVSDVAGDAGRDVPSIDTTGDVPRDGTTPDAADAGLDALADGAGDGMSGDLPIVDVAAPDAMMSCPPGTIACGARCTDTATNAVNCGACGHACAPGESCVAGTCACGPGEALCDGACTDTSTDPNNCGSCGQPCAAGQVCTGGTCGCTAGETTCGGVCTSTATDPANCGSCGHACAAGQACTAGGCGCPTGNTVCSGACADTSTDSNNCGSCGHACAAGQVCAGGRCGCAAGEATCGGECTITATDPANCGSCGHACAAGQTCVTGVCQACAAGQALCYGTCVDELGDRANCGACGHVCGGGERCDTGVCCSGPSCTRSGCLIMCGGRCSDPSTDPNNCGVCGRVCPTGVPCVRSACACAAGTMRCATGCVNLATSATNCGSCGHACPAGQICSLGRCGCSAPAMLCGAACVNTATDAHNCGRCGNSCEPGATCAGGTCHCSSTGSVMQCGAICANTLIDPANCGGCHVACAPGQTCTMGHCLCPFGQNLCGGACSALSGDPRNCGGCGRACAAGQVCTSGACVCTAGLTRCGTACVNLATANANCGACGTVCAGGQSCVSGACACPSGQSSCGGACATTAADPSNCGACGNVCPAGEVCTAGACRCAAGQTLCGSACVSLPSDPGNCGACGNACAAGSVCGGGVCGVPAPRPVAPLSTSTVTSRRPTLRWSLPTGVTTARVTLCADRGCARMIATADVTGASYAPTMDLPVGTVFWKLQSLAGGTPSVLSSPVWQFTVGARSAAVDTAWGTTLDVNGDGYADLAAGTSSTNQVRVYLGGASGPGTTPSFTLTQPPGTRASFGVSVASAGDVNGDGYGDLLVGASDSAGQAHLYLGGPTGLSSTPAVSLAVAGASGFGWAVTGIGDVNGDGYADVAIGSHGSPVSNSPVYVFTGVPGTGLSPTPAFMLNPPDSASNYGAVLAGAGDINGDGYADFAVGAYTYNGGGGTGSTAIVGRVYLYTGSAMGPGATPVLTLTNPGTPARGGYWYFGGSLSAGDINGDGYADLVVGCTDGFPTNQGAAYAYLGGAAGLGATPSWSLVPGSGHGDPGRSVSATGDINGDGYADLVVGADFTPATSTSPIGAGAAMVYPGSGSGLAASPSVTLAGPDGARGACGATVALLGDVNGDGYADLGVACPGVSSGAGVVHLYNGAAGGPAVSVTTTFTQSAGGFNISLARADEALRRFDRILGRWAVRSPLLD